jgi:hypothetical protein
LKNDSGQEFQGEKLIWDRPGQQLILSQFDNDMDRSEKWDLENAYFAIRNTTTADEVAQCLRQDF